MRKTIDLKEYIIKIYYNEKNSDLTVEVLDELGEVIDSLNVQDDNDDEETFNLN